MKKADLEFENILRNIRAPDDRLIEQIYKFYWGYLMAVAMRYISDRNMAHEVVNDSFMKAFKKMPDFAHNNEATDFQKTFKAWLAKITANTAVDRLRSKKPLVLLDEMPEEGAESYIDIEDKLHVEDIHRLFNCLPDLHRSIFNLYELEGFSHAEISEMLNIPESSSRVYLTRAKQKLKALYHNSMKISYAS